MASHTGQLEWINRSGVLLNKETDQITSHKTLVLIVVRDFNLSIQEVGAGRSCEFEASLVYIVSPG